MSQIRYDGAARRYAIIAGVGALAASLAAAAPVPARAQSLTVLPVSIQMEPGQKSTSLTIINQGDSPTAVQVRVYAWDQNDGPDGNQVLVPTDEVLTSPPARDARTVRRPDPATHPAPSAPGWGESAYRILIDQIPTPSAPGTVQIALRLSIPIFAEPAGQAAAHVTFHMERSARSGLSGGGQRRRPSRNLSRHRPDHVKGRRPEGRRQRLSVRAGRRHAPLANRKRRRPDRSRAGPFT